MNQPEFMSSRELTEGLLVVKPFNSQDLIGNSPLKLQHISL